MSSTPLRIEHVAIYTADLEATRDFFERYFHATAGQLYHNPTKSSSGRTSSPFPAAAHGWRS